MAKARFSSPYSFEWAKAAFQLNGLLQCYKNNDSVGQIVSECVKISKAILLLRFCCKQTQKVIPIRSETISVSILEESFLIEGEFIC